mmetsp:Transcript_33328/g.83957  ORF Transcript_33328/g.83957 Transcript_33328/m.83957 type:complete len:326 (+) Transcript_33328:321-1298(+)
MSAALQWRGTCQSRLIQAVVGLRHPLLHRPAAPITPRRFASVAASAASALTMAVPYNLAPLPIVGAVVEGVDLNAPVSEDLAATITHDAFEHSLLLFRGQGKVSGDRQCEISRWFGEIESRPFGKHPRSPNTDVFRVSNVAAEGCTGVGRTGWHIDGSFMDAPYQVSCYHMHAVPTRGATAFVSLEALINRMSDDQRSKWDRLWMCSDRQTGPQHPVLYKHPVTGRSTMCLHLGMTRGFIWDKGTPDSRVTGEAETEALLGELEQLLQENEDLVYRHEWKDGDFLITDNLALAHEATPETQLPVSQVGLRILHRTTVAGVHVPSK